MAVVPLRIAGGAKRYPDGPRGTLIFQGIDLEVEDGEILALLGPSGCGKSTLLRVIAGLEELSEGTIEIDSGGVATHSVGMVFQQPLLLPWLTVAQNVELGLRYAANRHARRDGAVDGLLREFGLAELANAYPDQLSGGQAQRVSFARTIATRPRLVLLDEPFAALDPLTRSALQNWLLAIQQSLGLTIIIVTHDVEEAVYLGDRVALMSPGPGTIRHDWRLGRSTAEGRSDQRLAAAREEILARYRDLDVAARTPSSTLATAGVAASPLGHASRHA
ncbi:MAG: ABC transporter ATP-binding protein [Dehalococcoidia bacterium]